MSWPGRLRVVTPENVEFEFEIAHLASRLAAFAIDAVVVSVLFVLVALGALLLATLAGRETMAPALLVSLYLLTQVGYFTVVEFATGGRSVGKRRLRLRVVQDSGVPVSAGQVLLRNALRLVDLVPAFYGVGAGSVLLTARGQRLGDLVAGTIVVREERRVAPRSVRSPGAGGAEGPLAGAEDLRRRALERLSTEEGDLILQLCLRRHALAREARVRILAGTRELIERRLDLVKPDHLSDERFVAEVGRVLAEGPPA